MERPRERLKHLGKKRKGRGCACTISGGGSSSSIVNLIPIFRAKGQEGK
jgi:hypothetical protein